MDEPDFRFLAEHAFDMICEVDSSLVMSYTSPSCEQLLGWRLEEMVGKGPDVFVHPEDLPAVAMAHEALMRDGYDRSPTVVRMRTKPGGYKWMEINARVVSKPADKQGYHVVLVMRDVGFRRERAADSRSRAAQGDSRVSTRGAHGQASSEWDECFYKTFRLAPVPMFIATQPVIGLVDVNTAFSDTFGYSAADVVTHTAVETGFFSRLQHERLIATIKTLGYAKNLEVDVRHHDATLRHCLASAETISIHGQRCILAALQDLTEQRHADGDLIAALESVMNDASWFSRAFIEKLAQVRKRNGAGTLAAELTDLTQREYEVLSLMCKGLGDSDIAAELSISSNTIRNHISRIYDKIGIHKRGAAIVWARERGVSVDAGHVEKPAGNRRR